MNHYNTAINNLLIILKKIIVKPIQYSINIIHHSES